MFPVVKKYILQNIHYFKNSVKVLINIRLIVFEFTFSEVLTKNYGQQLEKNEA